MRLSNKEVREIVQDWAKYFEEHRGQIPKEDLSKRLEFCEHMISGLFQALAAAARENNASSNIWLPR